MLPSPGLHLTERQKTLLAGGVALFSALSLLSSLLIIFTHWYWPKLRMKSLKLVAFMSVALAGADLTALVFISGGDCGWYTFLTNFFVISAALWSAVLSRTLSLVLNRNNLSSHLSRLNSIARRRGGCLQWLFRNIDGIRMFVFHTLVWGVSFFCAVAIDVDTRSKPSLSNWCWFQATNSNHSDDAISNDDVDNIGESPNLLQLSFFFVPVGFSMLYNMKTLFWASFREFFLRKCTERGRDAELIADIRQGTNEDELEASIAQFARRFRYYIALSLMVSVWLFVTELINVYDSSRQNVIWSYCVLLVVFRLHGFGNLVIYLCRDDVRDAWLEEVYRWLGHIYLPKTIESVEEGQVESPRDHHPGNEGSDQRDSVSFNSNRYSHNNRNDDSMSSAKSSNHGYNHIHATSSAGDITTNSEKSLISQNYSVTVATAEDVIENSQSAYHAHYDVPLSPDPDTSGGDHSSIKDRSQFTDSDRETLVSVHSSIRGNSPSNDFHKSFTERSSHNTSHSSLSNHSNSCMRLSDDRLLDLNVSVDILEEGD